MRRARIAEMMTLPGGETANDDVAGGHAEEAHGHAWVIDGATGLSEQVYVPDAASDAAWIAQRYSHYFNDLPRSDAAVGEEMRRAIERVRGDYRDAVGDADRVPVYALPSAAGLYCGWRVVEDLAHIRFSALGDCSAILLDGGGAVHTVGALAEGSRDGPLRDYIHQFNQKLRNPNQTVRDGIMAELRKQRSWMNTPGGYWIFGLEPEAAAHLRQCVLDVPLPASVLMMTDGFARLIDHFEAYSAATLIEAATENGLDPLMKELRSLEAGDPDCRTYPRVKKEDDATGLLIYINGDP